MHCYCQQKRYLFVIDGSNERAVRSVSKGDESVLCEFNFTNIFAAS
jgi:hypothetical protein